MHLLSFHGKGFVLEEDYAYPGGLTYRKGDRLDVRLSFLSPRELREWPLRINPEVAVRETGRGKRYLEIVDTVTCHGVTLGQVLQGIVWELSFYGAPPERGAKRNDVGALLHTLGQRRRETS